MGRVTDSDKPESTPGFAERGRMRRRARFLRKARELAYRDLGGLVFDLHRFGQRNDPVVMAKLSTLSQIDTELRALQDALNERRGVSVLREVGIAACPRCAAIHPSNDRFCSGCGLAFDVNADRPISTSPVSQQPSVAPGPQPPTSPPAVPQLLPTSVAPSPPALPDRPLARPVAAPAPADRTASPDEHDDDKGKDEEEPTKILRPPASST